MKPFVKDAAGRAADAQARVREAREKALRTPFEPVVLDDGVAIFPNQEADVTEGGIVKPEMNKKRPRDGIVLGVGSQVSDLTRGQTVGFGRYAGEELELEHCGQKVILLRRQDCRFILPTASASGS